MDLIYYLNNNNLDYCSHKTKPINNNLLIVQINLPMWLLYHYMQITYYWPNLSITLLNTIICFWGGHENDKQTQSVWPPQHITTNVS